LLSAWLAALGFHLVSLCALPWLALLVARAGRETSALPARRWLPRAHLVLLLAAAGVLLGLALARGELGRSFEYWTGFVPSFAPSVLAELGEHARRGGVLLGEGAPVLLVAGALAAWRLRKRPAELGEAVALGAPYLFAFALFGKPLVGLLAPVLLACAWLALAAARTLPRPAPWLAAALLAQLGVVVPQALEWHRDPGPDRRRAELIARH